MLDKNFMLTGSTARFLYNEVAKNTPIYDYHCHLSAKEIFEDKEFDDISTLWLGYDHYKWRALRYAGVSEEYITGNASGLAKFKMWAKVCEKLIGSPLYHWAHMELKTYFDVDEFLKSSNAENIYNHCNNKIKNKNLSPVKMIKNSNVKLICTTDDPTDGLEYHKLLLSNNDLGFKVLPTFRPDNVLNINKNEFYNYIENLSATVNLTIETYDDLIEALKMRIEYFNSTGCLLSDHSIENISCFKTNRKEVEEIFTKKIKGTSISSEEVQKYRNYTLSLLAKEYSKYNWVMQLHIGAMRNNNEIMLDKLGADTGFDIMNDFEIAEPLSRLLNEMNSQKCLPKTILYTLNPKDNLVLSTLPQCYPEDGLPGKIQFGTAWWFNDHKEGMLSHLKSISNQGMLPYFIGMLTDSRSFLSYVRHDYFRRILCSFIGEFVDNGEFDYDFKVLEEIVENICYKNVKNYIGVEV